MLLVLLDVKKTREERAVKQEDGTFMVLERRDEHRKMKKT
jgi:hypothetical protein